MTLYWYMHWFWITTCFANGEIVTTTTAHSTMPMSTVVHHSTKPTFPVIPSTNSPKQISVIEQITSMSDNFTLGNITESYNLTEFNSSGSEAMATSERVSTVLNEVANVSRLSAAGIAGITLGCVSLFGIISAISFIIYRNRGLNRPQVLNDHCSNLDSSGYIDDTSVRDNSEEMYSLDNDSFLNSLEAMTIQNYWTDTVKHTKL